MLGRWIQPLVKIKRGRTQKTNMTLRKANRTNRKWIFIHFYIFFVFVAFISLWFDDSGCWTQPFLSTHRIIQGVLAVLPSHVESWHGGGVVTLPFLLDLLVSPLPFLLLLHRHCARISVQEVEQLMRNSQDRIKKQRYTWCFIEFLVVLFIIKIKFNQWNWHLDPDLNLDTSVFEFSDWCR